MRPEAVVLYLFVFVCACVGWVVRFNALVSEAGEDFSRLPTAAAVAAAAESSALMVLATALGATLNNRSGRPATHDGEGETRVSVKTPPGGGHQVSAKIVVTNHPRQTKADSADFELTLD